MTRQIEEHGVACAGAAKALGAIRARLAQDPTDVVAQQIEQHLIAEIDAHQKAMRMDASSSTTRIVGAMVASAGHVDIGQG